jgi:hypothetical protein
MIRMMPIRSAMAKFVLTWLLLTRAVLGDDTTIDKVVVLPLWTVLDGKGYATNSRLQSHDMDIRIDGN